MISYLSWILRRILRNVSLVLLISFIIFVVFTLHHLYSTQNSGKRDSNALHDDYVDKDMADKIAMFHYNKESFDDDKNYDKAKNKFGSISLLDKSFSDGEKHFPTVTSDFKTKNYQPCYNVHVFYYPWYGNPATDGSFIHWNHKYLPHWSPEVAKMHPSGDHVPPLDIGSNFYPELGAYSSGDLHVIESHMQQILTASIGVLAVSYYPPGLSDDNGKDWQFILPKIFNAAAKYNLKVTFHIEPYKERSEVTLKKDIEHILKVYGSHPAFYRHVHKGSLRPLIYIYDSYHTKPEHWSQLLGSKNSTLSIRGTASDCFVIGLLVGENHKQDIISAGFDGFYTYFAANGFTYGSSRYNWKDLKSFADQNHLLYIPSIGPGYIDTRVRPWNSENTRKRLNGKYYIDSWSAALNVKPDLISITSFNEWHEGTQIERAISNQVNNYKYLDYVPSSPDFYLTLTKKYIQTFPKCFV